MSGSLSDAHHEIGRDRRYATCRVESIQAGNRGGVAAVEVHDCAALRTFLIHREMQEIFLAGFGAGNQISVPIQLGEIGRIELSKTGIRGSQQPAIFQAGADVAAAPGTQSTLVKTASDCRRCVLEVLIRCSFSWSEKSPCVHKKFFRSEVS